MSEAHAAVGFSTLVAPAINLLILIVFMVVKLKKPTLDFVSTRYTYVRDEVVRVSDHLKNAQEKFEEFAAKLKAVDVEIRAIREQSLQDAQTMKIRIAGEAKKLAAAIVLDSEDSARGLYLELRSQLRFELGNRVLDRAEVILRSRLTVDDRARIRNDFSKQVEQIR